MSRALCRVSVWVCEMQPGGSSWGCLWPSSKLSVVSNAIVPHDHGGRGASSWIAILGMCLYEGRGVWVAPAL